MNGKQIFEKINQDKEQYYYLTKDENGVVKAFTHQPDEEDLYWYCPCRDNVEITLDNVDVEEFRDQDWKECYLEYSEGLIRKYQNEIKEQKKRLAYRDKNLYQVGDVWYNTDYNDYAVITDIFEDFISGITKSGKVFTRKLSDYPEGIGLTDKKGHYANWKIAAEITFGVK